MLCDFLNIPQLNPDELNLRAANVSADPPSFLLAKLGRGTAHALRNAGLYRIVNSAKSLGLKGFFFGETNIGSRPIGPTAEELDWLTREIARRDNPSNIEFY